MYQVSQPLPQLTVPYPTATRDEHEASRIAISPPTLLIPRMSDITHIISALKVTGSSPASTLLLANIPLKEAQDRLKPHPVEFQFESCHRSKFQRAQITLQYTTQLSDVGADLT
jgi:hypothetical protein